MHPRYKKTYLHRHKKIRVPTNSIISDCDYIISASNYIISACDYIIAGTDYRISRHLRKNYSERKILFLHRCKKLLLLNWV